MSTTNTHSVSERATVKDGKWYRDGEMRIPFSQPAMVMAGTEVDCSDGDYEVTLTVSRVSPQEPPR